MALSLSPHHFKQAIPLSKPLLQSHLATNIPRQFRTDAHDSPDNETFSINQIIEPSDSDPLLLSHDGPSNLITRVEDVNKLASASRGHSDLPSWTPLKTSGDDEASVIPDNEVDKLSTGNTARPRTPTNNGRGSTDTDATATGILKLKSSTDVKSTSKGKRARFDGVLITSKPPSHKKHSSKPGPSAPISSSRMRQLSLVDALARTFDANRHTEGSHRHSRTALPKDNGGSPTPGLQTDAETTEAEEEQLQLNTRLAHSTLKRRTRGVVISERASENNSEDSALLPQRDTDRSVKRLKVISYDANTALVEAALGTVEAPLGWDAELDFITREDDFAPPMTSMTQNAFAASGDTEEDVQMVVDQGVDDPTSEPTAEKALITPSNPAAVNECGAPTLKQPRRLFRYLSRGAKFIQRLDAIYGENATVRTDRVARPIPVDLDLFAPFDEQDDNHSESSSSPSESTAPMSIAPVAGEGMGTSPNTHNTSQFGSPSAELVAGGMDPDGLSRNEHNRVVIDLTQPLCDTSEDTMGNWIAVLQRLVKGKVRIKEEDLETVSIILAEIESVKYNLGENVSMTSELRESVKQLSELHEIPFGDRNKLRQRAEVIFHTWPSMKELETS